MLGLNSQFFGSVLNFLFVSYQMLMSAVPLVRCAGMDGVSMKLVLSSVCVMKDMSSLWMARIVLVSMKPHDVQVLVS